MLAGFSALNERADALSDHDSSDNGSSSESADFRDEDYLELYNRALQNFGEEAYQRAENEFRYLVKSPYFAQCGFYAGHKKRQVTVRLQFNAHRYLGICLSKREAFAESLNEVNFNVPNQSNFQKYLVHNHIEFQTNLSFDIQNFGLRQRSSVFYQIY